MKNKYPSGGFGKLLIVNTIGILLFVPYAFCSPVLTKEKVNGLIEEMIVTARKRDERAIDIPVSITVMSSAAIVEAGVTGLTEMFALVPSVENNADGGRIANKPAIRGVGSQENASVRQKVTTLIDGVPIIGAQGIGSFAGVERVEILRGPQSAAFGRSTFGGAINYVTRTPGENFEFNLLVNLADHDTRDIGAVLSLPALRDSVGILISLEDKYYGGDSEWKTTSDEPLGQTNDKLASIKLAFDVNQKLDAEVIVMRQEIDDSPSPVIFASTSQLEPHPDDSDGLCAINGGMNSCVIQGELQSVPLNFDYDYDNERNPILDPGTRITRNRTQGLLSMNLDNGRKLTALAAYTAEEGETWLDRDTFSSVRAIHSASSPESVEKYAELRLMSPLESPVIWLVGASLYDYDYSNTVFRNKTDEALMGLFSEGATNVGVFFNLDYQAIDRLRVSLEGRYQIDKISGELPANPSRGLAAPVFEEDTTRSFLPRVALTYSVNTRKNFYLQVSRGNNPAAFNTIAFDPVLLMTAKDEGYNLPAFKMFDEEEIWNYELGLKGESHRKNLRYYASVYYLDWKGYVQPVTGDWTPDDGVLLPGTTPNDYFQRLFLNTGDLAGVGAEIEMQWRPTERLIFGGYLSYSGLEFADDACSPIPLDYGVAASRTEPYACASVAGSIPPNISQFTGALNVTYTFPLRDVFEGYSRFDYRYRSKRYAEQTNTDYIPSFYTIDFRFGVRSNDWSLEIYAKNLLNDDTPSGAVRFFDSRLPGMVFNTTYQARRPRSVGIRLAYDI